MEESLVKENQRCMERTGRARPTGLLRGFLAVALLAAAGAALGQAQSGNVYGKVTDEQGGALPGVSVTISGVGSPLSTVTNGAGEYRFVNLSPGRYAVAHALSGFAGVNRDNVTVNVGKNTELAISMKLSGVSTQMTVTGETPILDSRRMNTGATVSQVELKSIPTARDPWVVLQSVPGVQTDRINVGGNESGQQSSYVAKGSSGTAGVWNVDGVNVTDVGAVGSSPTYYDFDSFEEMQVSTGGADVAQMTAGATLNMVTKRGTNDVHSSARVLATDKRWQADTHNDEATAQGFQRGNRIDDIQDYGLDVGGPIVKDRLWLWGAYGRNQINLRTPATAQFSEGFSDKTTLEDINAKMNGQLSSGNAATLFYTRGDKIKLGRNAAPTRETTWDQSGPTSLYKVEDSQIFSPNLFATVFGSYVDGGFQFVPEGGADAYAYRSPDGINHGTYYFYDTTRPQRQLATNASAFARTGEIGHEFKFGFSYRNAPVESDLTWPHGNRVVERNRGGIAGNGSEVRIYRTQNAPYDTQFYGTYLSDTITVKDLTINVGARYDNQSGHLKQAISSANELFPDVFPTIRQPDAAKPFTWENVSPRVGLTYAIGKDANKTLLRASYGRFVDNLGGGNLLFNSSTYYGYIAYKWHDLNGDHRAQRSEVDFNSLVYAYNVSATNPGSLSPNRIDPNFKSPTTDEFVLGFEREVVPGIAVSLNGTYRKTKNLAWFPSYGLNPDGSVHVYTPADFEALPGNAVTGVDSQGHPYSIPVYSLKASAPATAGRYEANRPDYTQDYKGLELQINKRYSDKWSMRLGFTYSDWKQHLGANSISDPTNVLSTGIYGGTSGGSSEDGGDVLFSSGVGSGAKGGVFVNSKWNMNLNALYSLPLGFNVAGNLFARQGYVYPNIDTNADPGDGLGARNALALPASAVRHPTVTELDLRLEKMIKVAQLDVTLGIDVFNVFNSNVVLQRQIDRAQSVNVGGDIQEIQSPRVVRFGGRVSF
jgi:hypothetical protein